MPLYTMNPGNLGTDFESSLNQALVVCKLWIAMLLLDDVDVMMGTRFKSNFDRNELMAGGQSLSHNTFVRRA